MAPSRDRLEDELRQLFEEVQRVAIRASWHLNAQRPFSVEVTQLDALADRARTLHANLTSIGAS